MVVWWVPGRVVRCSGKWKWEKNDHYTWKSFSFYRQDVRRRLLLFWRKHESACQGERVSHKIEKTKTAKTIPWCKLYVLTEPLVLSSLLIVSFVTNLKRCLMWFSCQQNKDWRPISQNATYFYISFLLFPACFSWSRETTNSITN